MKTRPLTLIPCIIIIFLCCTRPGDDLPIPDSTICYTINQFVNEILPPSSNVFYNKASYNFLSSYDSLYLIELNPLLSLKDIDYIFNQNRTSNDYDLSNCLYNKVLITHQTIMENPNLGYFDISAPLFSIDKEVVIIRISYFCGGLCGNGGTYVYKKENNIWLLKFTLSEWIS